MGIEKLALFRQFGEKNLLSQIETLYRDIASRINQVLGLNGFATWDPPNVVDTANTTTTVTVKGAAVGDYVVVSFSVAWGGLIPVVQITAADTVTITLHNHTGGAVDLDEGMLRARVWKL